MPRRIASKPGFSADRNSIKELVSTRTSMLSGADVPVGYNTFDEGSAIMKELTDPRVDKRRIARLFIVWDQPFSNLDEVESVLDQMRSYGAAMVERVEEVK